MARIDIHRLPQAGPVFPVFEYHGCVRCKAPMPVSSIPLKCGPCKAEWRERMGHPHKAQTVPRLSTQRFVG